MKSEKHVKKGRKELETAFFQDRERDKIAKIKKNSKMKKQMDWRDLLMEEEENLLNDR